VVVGDQSTTIGRTPSYHDLSQVPHLRSHGGFEEQTVPFFVNRPLKHEFAKRLTRGQVRNFHMFEYLCNGFE